MNEPATVEDRLAALEEEVGTLTARTAQLLRSLDFVGSLLSRSVADLVTAKAYD